MKKSMRRRRADSSSDEEDGHAGSGQEDAAANKKTLAELREEMKQRKARGGIQAASTLETVGTAAEDAAAKGKKRPAVEAEEEDDEEGEKKSIGQMMESSFTGLRYVKKDDRTPHERIMEEYIKEQLEAKGLSSSKKKGGGGDGSGDGGLGEDGDGQQQGGSSRLSRQDKLRQITEEIHAKARPEGKKGYADQEAADRVSEGGPIAYSTGIAEVALPIEFKLRNIEATEKAQKRAMETAGKRGERPEDIVGNLTNNYFHHRREHAIEMRAREGKPAGVFRRPDGEGPQGKAAMTDDQVYQRFHKRNRR